MSICEFCEHRQAETGYQNHKPTIIEYCELNHRYPKDKCQDYQPATIEEAREE